MTLLQNKIDMETYFKTNYTYTDVHWAGMDFDTEAYDKWIYFEYRGSSIMDRSLDQTDNRYEGAVYMVAVGSTPFEATQIADNALALFDGKKIGDMFVGRADVISQGYYKELNKSYIEIELYATSY